MRRLLCGFILVASVLVFFAAWTRLDAAGRQRQVVAEGWTQETEGHPAFTAVGMSGNQLVVVPEFAEFGPGGQAECDADVDSLVLNKKFVQELRRQGFASIQCGVRSVAVR